MNINAARRGITRLVQGLMTLMMVLVVSFLAGLTPVKADAALAEQLCGNGSAPDYGFTYAQQQSHWTVGGRGDVSQDALNEVDAILDELNGDSIAQTMILILPQEQVGNRVNCAVHFLRYMQLGLPTGTRKDNGFVFLMVVEPDAIDVHYGVGLGLPALTASELTTLNRTAEDAYQSSQSIDQALLALVQGFDTVARNNYAPLTSASPNAGTENQPQTPAGPLDILTICGQLCFGILFLFLLIFVRPFLARRGININPTGFGGGWGGGRGWGGGSGGGGGGFGGGRGGSGSGRSGRGN